MQNNSSETERAWINIPVQGGGEKFIQQNSSFEGHCILERKQTDLEDEPDKGPQCRGNSLFQTNKHLLSFLEREQEKEREARRRKRERVENPGGEEWEITEGQFCNLLVYALVSVAECPSNRFSNHRLQFT